MLLVKPPALSIRSSPTTGSLIIGRSTGDKLRKINETLEKQAFRLRKQVEIIYAFQEKLLKDKVIDDYEVDVEMECWNNRYYRRWNEEFDGNSFYTDYILNLFNEDEPDIFFTDNWNEYQYRPDHPLSKEVHCYFFHHLYDHTYLAWEDILRIDEIWIEVYAINQFFFDVPGKEKKVKIKQVKRIS